MPEIALKGLDSTSPARRCPVQTKSSGELEKSAVTYFVT